MTNKIKSSKNFMILKNRRNIKMNIDKNSSDCETKAERSIKYGQSENKNFENRSLLKNLKSSNTGLLMKQINVNSSKNSEWRHCSPWRNKEQRCKLLYSKWLFGIHSILIWFKRCLLGIVMENRLLRRWEKQQRRIIDQDET